MSIRSFCFYAAMVRTFLCAALEDTERYLITVCFGSAETLSKEKMLCAKVVRQDRPYFMRKLSHCFVRKSVGKLIGEAVLCATVR